MTRLLVALAIVAAASAIALVLRRRRPDAPTQPRYEAPSLLDRADFPEATGEWLVVAFTSASCHTCADVVRKARVAASRAVSVVEVEYTASRDLHQRYRIDAVPTLVVADADGVVHRSFLGPVSATDLWMAIAAVRDPTLAAEPCHRDDHPDGPSDP